MLKFRWETKFRETEIGEIPEDWNIKKLGEISKDSIVGSTPLKRNSKFWQNGTIPWLTNKEVEFDQINYICDTEKKVNEIALKETNLKLLPVYSLVLSFTASVGKVAINKIPITTNQQFISFILKDGFNVEYYAYYFILSRELIESYSGATPFSFITKERALTIPVPYPLQFEQNRIATVLSWLESLIQNKKRQNEVLEKVAMAVFKSWFVDFEPFRDGEFVPSELGEIPKGWKVGRLIDASEIIMGQSPPSKYYNEDGEGLPFIQGKGQFGKYTPETTIYCSTEGKTAKPHDILVTVRAPVGELNIADKDYIIGRGVASLRSKYWSFIFAWLKQNNELIKAYERGTTFDAITKQELENFPILLPPTPILETFNSKTQPLFQKILLNQRQIVILKAIRDTLLPLLVFGKLRVEEV